MRRVPSWQDVCPDYVIKYYEERAAIMQYDGGRSRPDAEAAAYRETITHFYAPRPNLQRERKPHE